MCWSSPDIPGAGPPPQEAKTPTTDGLKRRKKPTPQGGSLLTNPTGTLPVTAAPSLLGGG